MKCTFLQHIEGLGEVTDAVLYVVYIQLVEQGALPQVILLVPVPLHAPEHPTESKRVAHVCQLQFDHSGRHVPFAGHWWGGSLWERAAEELLETEVAVGFAGVNRQLLCEALQNLIRHLRKCAWAEQQWIVYLPKQKKDWLLYMYMYSMFLLTFQCIPLLLILFKPHVN